MQNIVNTLLSFLAREGDCTLNLVHLEGFSKSAINFFESAGWLKPSSWVTNIECPGCEENCFMHVNVLPAQNGWPTEAFVACDQRHDMGNINIPLHDLKQWKLTHQQVAKWVASTLGLKGDLQKDVKTGVIRLGSIQGKNLVSELYSAINDSIYLKTPFHSMPLIEFIEIVDGLPVLNRKAVLRLVNMSSKSASKGGYKPCTDRRDSQKQETDKRHLKVAKTYTEYHEKFPDMKNDQLSKYLVKHKIITNYSSESIRRIVRMKGVSF